MRMIHLRLAPDTDVDVIVAGAGPAGAATSAYLARDGFRVLLIDAQQFPRDKVCGDFVSPVALVELERLGVTKQARYPTTNQVRSAALHVDGKCLIRRPFPQIDGFPSYGRVIPRIELDAWIVDAARQAGVTLLDQTRVTGYEQEPGAVRVTATRGRESMSLRARLLVGADGSNSVVARQLRGHGNDASNRIVAIRAYYEGVSGITDQADLYFGEQSFPGYYWLFPTGLRTANVGIGVALNTVPATEVQLREQLRELVQNDPALARRLDGARLVGKVVGWPLATYDPALPLVADRVLLVGDAANLINPMNGEGIQTAVLSARWAAEAVRALLRANTLTAGDLAPYVQCVERELGFDMALARFLVQCIRNRSLNRAWLQGLRVVCTRARKDEQYALLAGGILAGVVPASNALGFKLIEGTIRQAVSSAGMGLVRAAFAGPRGVMDLGLDAARLGFTFSYDFMKQPDDVARWFLGVVTDAVSLLGQATRSTLRGLGPDGAAEAGSVKMRALK